jgi:hypothetical protein
MEILSLLLIILRPILILLFLWISLKPILKVELTSNNPHLSSPIIKFLFPVKIAEPASVPMKTELLSS